MLTNYPVNPRIRAYGKARIDLALRLKNSTDWDRQWKPPSHPFPFTWGESWKQCIEYRVDDFAAEVGFFIDVLGFPIKALDHSYAMFTSPQQDFFFAIVPTTADETPTSPEAFRLQFMVRDVNATYQELLRRGIAFELSPQPLCQASSIMITSFRTPNGIPVEIWGISMDKSVPPQELRVGNNLAELLNADNKDEPDEDGDDEDFDEEYEGHETNEDGFDENEEENDEDLDGDEQFDEEGDEEEEDGEDEDIDKEEDEFDYSEDDYDLEDSEDDDDEDDFESDEYSGSTLKIPSKHVRSESSNQAYTADPASSKRLSETRQPQLLEYIDVETT